MTRKRKKSSLLGVLLGCIHWGSSFRLVFVANPCVVSVPIISDRETFSIIQALVWQVYCEKIRCEEHQYSSFHVSTKETKYRGMKKPRKTRSILDDDPCELRLPRTRFVLIYVYLCVDMSLDPQWRNSAHVLVYTINPIDSFTRIILFKVVATLERFSTQFFKHFSRIHHGTAEILGMQILSFFTLSHGVSNRFFSITFFAGNFLLSTLITVFFYMILMKNG